MIYAAFACIASTVFGVGAWLWSGDSRLLLFCLPVLLLVRGC